MISQLPLQGEMMPFSRDNPSLAIDEWIEKATKFIGTDRRNLRSSKLPDPLAARLHDFQTLMSKVSMHFGPKFSVELNRQLISLLDSEQWEEDDVLPSVQSFKTFYRALVFLEVEKRPGLGVGIDGSMVAAWTIGANRLTLECKKGDAVHWVLSRSNNLEVPEKAAGITIVTRLHAVLEPYSPNDWFKHA